MWNKIFTKNFMTSYNLYWKYPLLTSHIIYGTYNLAIINTSNKPNWNDYVYFAGIITPAMLSSTYFFPLAPLIGFPLVELWLYSGYKRMRTN